jgi:hypothetical protein
MKYVNVLRQRVSLVMTLALACAVIAGITWQASSKNKPEPGKFTAEDTKQNLRQKALSGVGKGVRFASSSSSSAEVDASVDSVAGFINERSGLEMSAETAKRIKQAEKDILKGKGHRLSTAELTDTLTDITIERLSVLTDQEIELAANTYSATPDGEISSRDGGRWGHLTKDEFVGQVKAARGWATHGDSALRATVRPLVEEEVNVRVKYLSESLPEQFGNVPTQGASATQALLLAYSVATDDHLLGSRSELEQEKVGRRMAAKQTRADKKQARRESAKPYGVGGYLHSSPAGLFFSRGAVDKLVSRTEGGQN